MKTTIKLFVLSAILLLPTAAALAAGVRLINGGFGQLAGNAQQFGVAVCDGGTKAVAQSVPVLVSVNAQTATVLSAPNIKAGGCEYSYLSYGDLGMQPGGTYSVSVTIDPQRTAISNTDNKTSYSVTVPGVKAAANPEKAAIADVNAQSGNFFSMLVNWLGGLFK